MTYRQKFSLIRQLPSQEKRWLLIFFCGSLVAWCAIRLIPLRKLALLMGHPLGNTQVCIPVTPCALDKARRMGELMSRVGNNTPWESKCLSQALCVKWLLNRNKIPSVFYLGALLSGGDNQQTSLKAHAWIDVHGTTIIGETQELDYTVSGTFTTPQL